MRKIILLNVLFCLCFGCGTGHYEELLEKNINKRRASAPPDLLSAAQDVPGTKVSIRVPTKLGSPAANLEGSRSMPGIVTIPGLKQTYEAFLKDGAGGELPYYCYVGVVEAAGGPMQLVADKLQEELGKQPKPNGNWTDIQVETAGGIKVPWRKFRFTGDQQFYYKDAKGQGKPQSMPGTLEIYLHEEAGSIVIIAWRMPTSIEPEKYVGLDEMARLTAGGVSVRP